jgi:very-short-patch-repair endonuclease
MSEFRPNRKRSARFSAQADLTLSRARELRKSMTPPERKLWLRLRGEKLGFRFRRQHPAGPFILDFFCAEANLAVELDGAMHDPDHDRQRDIWLGERNIEVLRISVSSFEQDPGAALTRIRQTCERRTHR